MKHLLIKLRPSFAVACLLVIAAIGNAQKSPPAPAADFDPAQWKEFVSKEGGFKIKMPGVPTAVTQPVESKSGTVVAHFHSLITKSAEYVVGYTEVSQNLETVQPSKGTLDAIRDRTLAKENGKLLSEQDVSVAGHPGRALVIEVSDGVFRDKYFLVANRLYTVTVFTPATNGQSDGDTARIRRAQETVANAFLDSFSLLTK